MTYQVNAQSLDGIVCQHCGGEVGWLVPPAPVPIEDKDTPLSTAPSMDAPDIPGFPEESNLAAQDEPSGQQGDVLDRDSESILLARMKSLERSAAPTAVPSQDRATRPLDVSGELDDDGEPTGLFNKPVPSLPRLKAPGSTVDEVVSETALDDDEEPPETQVGLTDFSSSQFLAESRASGPPRYGRSVALFVASIVIGGLIALLFK